MKTIWKKGLALILAVACLAMLAAGCGDGPADSSAPDSSVDTSGDGSSTTDSSSTTGGESTGDTSATDSTATGDPSATQPGGTTTDGGNGGDKPTTAKPTTGKTTATQAPVKSNYYQNSKGKTFQNFTFDYEAVMSSYNVDKKFTIQDLGEMQLEEYPKDGVYDSAFNCIKVGDTYKMWWCRACPFDTIWYAESKDMKNWYNAQLCIDLNGYETTWIKQMMAWSSVLYINGKYHMFFEAPAKIAESGEYSNNIFYATSKDGIDWTFYPNNKNPQPVIKDPVVKEGVYGVGQPKAFYKDGYFYVTYTDASTSGGNIRVARSKGNGFSFEGNVSDHPMVLEGAAGAAIRYNETTKKYYLMVTASETQSNGVYNDNMFIMESDDLYNWPCKNRAQLLSKSHRVSKANDVVKKGNMDLVTDEKGIVSGENMVLMYMEGDMPSANEDHRNTHTTWDGHIMLLGVGSQYGKTLTLPNGKTASKTNLEWYADKIATWKRPSVSVAKGSPKIDGTKDAVYGKGGTALIETVTWSYEFSKPTDTAGKMHLAWDENALYLYAEVKDATGPYTGYDLEKPGNLWRNDSLTLFIDVPDTKTGTTNSETLTPLSFMVLIDAAGTFTVKDSSEVVCTNEFSGYEVKTKKISGGYVIEAKIPWYDFVKEQVKSGKTIGFDVQINDSFNDTVGRQAQVYWSDYTGDSFLYLDRWGQLKLQ